ncbi:hypothetical protein B0J18DRAFT_270929 [Chaetomium sp. MPI-SDFR-AT-0129]|nr:hypothetical protein B0J18DRAFT_270929 [Chaetomium sp. MPI-SDFR-AT-0129]
MDHHASEPVGWFTWILELRIVHPEYQYIIKAISTFFITLALIPIAPIIALVIYDVILWFWRLAIASFATWRARRTQRAAGSRTEPQRPPEADAHDSNHPTPGQTQTDGSAGRVYIDGPHDRGTERPDGSDQ